MTTLMVQGTTSDAGKSTLVTALCRWVKRQGVQPAPFKPQNMALNSVQTPEGGEIGRAQALQARAAGLAPHTDMNPILLKPHSDTGAWVIVNGQSIGHLKAGEYQAYRPQALQHALAAHARLAAQYPIVLVEGAGSPAEINLRKDDVANMGFAEAADCPVILIADINRGGVFAHVVGTLALLSPSERERVVGVVINRFRGDISLLQSGLDWLEKETGKPVLGVLPFWMDLHLEAEDGIDARQDIAGDTPLRVAVPVWSRIRQHTDLDSLRLHPQVSVEFVRPGADWPACDVVILPDSQSPCADVKAFIEQGGKAWLQRHLRYGGKVMGLGSGLAMLGERLADDQREEVGLGFLPMHAHCHVDSVQHAGEGDVIWGGTLQQPTASRIDLQGEALNRPLVRFADGRCEGVLSEDEQIAGSTYQDVLDDAHVLSGWLQWAGVNAVQTVDVNQRREADIERLADGVEQYLNTDLLRQWLNLPAGNSYA